MSSERDGAGPRFSVVLNTYERADVVGRAIDSVLAQTYPDFELVVVDDGSTDGTAEVVQAYGDPRVRYVARPNGGLAVARNTGLREARGALVAFMDDDDVVEPRWLAAFAEVVDPERTGIASCGTRIRTPGAPTAVRLPEPLGPAFDDQVGLFLPGTFCVRRDLLDDIGGYWEALRCSEQTELALRAVPACVRRGLRIDAVGEPLVVTNREIEERRPLRRADWLHDGAVLVLERHGERLRRAPRLYADFAAVAAVQAARLGRRAEARRWLRRAIVADPGRPKHWARLAVACVPPLARRAWGTWSPPGSAPPRPATAPRVEAGGIRALVPEPVKHLPVVRRFRRTTPPWPPRRRPVAAPVAPPEWISGPPDFVGIGVQRAGTSWWYELVCAHPAVHLNDGVPKEVHHFDRFHERAWTDADRAAYHALFPRPAGRITGEWTPEYVVWPWCPPLLAAAGVPKLLVLLRDPVDRYQAGYSFSVRRGAPAVSTIAGDAFHRGLYHRQLCWVLQHFDREQLLVLQYEACLADPCRELRRTYEFLGIDPSFVPDALTARVKAQHAKDDLPPGLRDLLTEAYRADLEALFAAHPELDPTLWPSAAGVVG